MSFEYKTKPINKLKADYSRRKQTGHDSFLNFESFEKWYNNQEKVCHYCGLLEKESQEIVMTSILKSNRFPQDGKLGRGQSRGVWLEVDRIKPKENYSPENCVLACYYCNNDKSDIFHGDDYKKFKTNRVEFLRELIQQNNDK
jgi:5-methylcytosine-specific restriction endonuclease McrA